ncbi:MAG: lysophospholipase [Lachnospiraceae bacterium]|nr:lysophospholipase [Lachnospiraceae bacterium]
MKRFKKIMICVACVLVVLLIAGLWTTSVSIYNDNFDQRFESYEPLKLYVEDFDGLNRTKYTFASDKGQILTGYLYTADEEPQGLIVLAHGFGGGGHNSYMDVANFFAQNGYAVFAYDATGNDESEGDGVGGLPQGVIDLDAALTFVEKEFPDLSIGLFGHSWGGYSVCNVLRYDHDIKAVISCSGFNRSSDLFESEGKKQAGAAIYLLLPFVKIHEFVKYGKTAVSTAMDGFKDSDANVLILHSADDNVVPIEYGYDIYYEKYKEDPRFSFIRLENKGHNYVYNDQEYVNELNDNFDKWLKTIDYDYLIPENREQFEKDRADYMTCILDREKWCNNLDMDLFETFLQFYNDNMK